MEHINRAVEVWAQEFATLAEIDELKVLQDAISNAIITKSILSFDEGVSELEQSLSAQPEYYDQIHGVIFRLLAEVPLDKLKAELNEIVTEMNETGYFKHLRPILDTPMDVFCFVLKIYYKQIIAELGRHIQIPTKKTRPTNA